MRRGLLLTLFGVGIGMVASLAVTRLAASLPVHASAAAKRLMQVRISETDPRGRSAECVDRRPEGG